MVTSSKAMSAGQAGTYFTDSYYTKDGITEKGQWTGKAAEELGLKGEVGEKDFVEVLNGYKPGSLDANQIKSIESLNKIEISLHSEAKELAKMADGEEKTALKADLDARIKDYNEARSDFHKDVKTGGLHSQIKDLKALKSKDPEVKETIKALTKEMKNLTKDDFRIGDRVSPADRDNFGEVVGFNKDTDQIKVKFVNPETGKTAEKLFARDDLDNLSDRVKESEKGQMIRDGKDEFGIAGHRAGFDLTFSAPKSVSIMALEVGDKRLIDGHHQAMAKAMEYVQSEFAQTRGYNEAGERERVNTGNLAAAQFTHYTSRGTEKGSVPDPQLHTHNMILNATKDGEKWMSLEPQQIYAAKKLADQIYQNEYARIVKDLGYGTEWNKLGNNYTFEIKGVGKELRDARSSRTGQIKAIIAEKEKETGRSLSAEEKNNITLNSRAYKDELNIDTLRDGWKESLNEMGYTKEGLIEATKERVNDKTIAGDATEAVKMAVENLHSQKAVFSEHELTLEALKAGQGSASLEEIRSAIRDNEKELLIEKTDTFQVGVDKNNSETKLFSSKEILKSEANIEKAVAAGKNTGAIMNKEDFSKAFEKVEAQKIRESEANGTKYHTLTEGQRGALEHIATSNDRFIGIQGDAGSGKTTALERMTKITEILKDTMGENVELIGLAPTNIAAGNIEKDAGITSRTVDSFINKPTEATEGKQQVYLVDESSILDTVKMEKLTQIAEKTGAKVVFIGDSKQLKPVGAGAMFDRLQKTGQMEFAHVTEVLRQKDGTVAKGVVEAFKNVETLGNGLDQLEKAGKLIEAKDGDMNPVRDAFVNNAATNYANHGMNSTIALVSTNADRHDFNAKIREKLVEFGAVSKDGKITKILEEKRLNKTDKQFAGNYKVGEILVANKADRAIERGGQTEISAINRQDNTVKISYKTKAGQPRSQWVKGSELDKFTAYTKAEKEFAQGDKIAFEKQDKNIGVQNGETGVIKSIDESGIWSVDKGDNNIVKVDPKDYPYVSHGYAMTVHKSQGQSIDRVHVFADSSKGGLSTNAGYVQMSRAKEELTVYTDDRANLEKQYKTEQLGENAGDRVDTKQFADEKQVETAQEGKIDFDAPVVAPKYEPVDRSASIADQIEDSYIARAKDEIKSIDSSIKEMRVEAKEMGDDAQAHWKSANGITQTRQSRDQHTFYAARSGAAAKDLKSGIRYQQLNKTEAKIMSRGEIDLKSTREFVEGKGFETEQQKAGFMASQAREREHLNNMVNDGILVVDPKNEEKYHLAVELSEFDDYRKSESNHESKAEIAQGDWNKAIGDEIFNNGQGKIDAALISGGSWSAKDAVTQMKDAGLYTKDNELMVERLQARYDRLADEGIVKKGFGGSYTATNKDQLKDYVGSQRDNLGKIMGEGQTSQQYKEVKQMKADTSIIPGAQRIDKAIERATHVNLHVLSKDIKSAHRTAAHWIGADGNPIAETLAGVVGVTLGTAKTATRAAAGLAYKAGKTAAKIVGKVASGAIFEGGARGMLMGFAEHYEHKNADVKAKWQKRFDKFFGKNPGAMRAEKIEKIKEAREARIKEIIAEREKAGLCKEEYKSSNPLLNEKDRGENFKEKLGQMEKDWGRKELKQDGTPKSAEEKLAKISGQKAPHEIDITKTESEVKEAENSPKTFHERAEEAGGRKLDDKEEKASDKDEEKSSSKGEEKEAEKAEERERD